MAREKISGHGGFWAVDGVSPFGYATRLDIGDYEVEVEGETYEHRSGGCQGWAENLPVIKRVRSASFEVPDSYDPEKEPDLDLSYPQALGLTENQEVTVWLKRGKVDQYDRLAAATVTNVTVRNPQTAARRVRVTLSGGRYARNVAAPNFGPPNDDDEEP